MASKIKLESNSIMVSLNPEEIKVIRWALEFVESVDNPNKPFGTVEYIKRWEKTNNLLKFWTKLK